jgi:hypothetical protein
LTLVSLAVNADEFVDRIHEELATVPPAIAARRRRVHVNSLLEIDGTP